MPGFFISNINDNFNLKNIFQDKCITNQIENDLYTIKRNTLNKFIDDKVFYEDDHYIIITEGVILNKNAMITKYGKNDFIETIKYISSQNEDTFYNEFRGSFSGAIFYKTKAKWIVFTNQLGDKAIYYYHIDGVFI